MATVRLRHKEGMADDGAKKCALYQAGPMAEAPVNARWGRWGSGLGEEEASIVRQRRQELALEGMSDTRIVKAVAKEKGWPAYSIRAIIRSSLASGEIPENPNRNRRIGADTMGYIIKRRARLMAKGWNDHRISAALAKEKELNADSLAAKISAMVASGALPPNPNKKFSFSEDERVYIKAQRQALMAQGFSDVESSKAIAKGKGWKIGSVGSVIRAAIKKGEIPKNPKGADKARKIFPWEKERLRLRRAGLIREGYRDAQIASVLSGEASCCVKTLDTLFRKMVKRGEAEPNPNKQENLSKGEIKLIKKRWAELCEEGLNNRQISKLLEAETGRTAGTIAIKLRGLTNAGVLPGNPNKKRSERFTKAELEHIGARRAELLAQGKSDGEASNVLSEEMGRSNKCIDAAIRRMVRRKSLPANPNKVEIFNEEEIRLISERRAQLIKSGAKDERIAKILSKETGRSADSIVTKIRQLVAAGGLPKNPNTQENLDEYKRSQLMKRRAELISEGLNDHRICQRLAPEMGKPVKTIQHVIEHMLRKKLLPQNPNKRRVSEEERVRIKEARGALILEGLNERQICLRIAGRFGRRPDTLLSFIRDCVRRGQFPENPHTRFAGKENGKGSGDILSAVRSAMAEYSGGQG